MHWKISSESCPLKFGKVTKRENSYQSRERPSKQLNLSNKNIAYGQKDQRGSCTSG